MSRNTHGICRLVGNVLVAQSCPTLCNPMDYSPPGSSIHGVFQARYWSGLSLSSPKLVTESCLTLCDPMDCSPPGSFSKGGFIMSRNTHGTCRLVGKTDISQTVTGIRAYLQWSKCSGKNAALKEADRCMKRPWQEPQYEQAQVRAKGWQPGQKTGNGEGG